MSRALDAYKRQLKRLSGNAAGQNYDFSRPWSSQQLTDRHLEEIYALPVDTEFGVIDLNTASGALVFVPGLSDPGGTDVLV